MADNSATAPQTNEDAFAESKGKGKAAADQVDDATMDEEESDSDEDEERVEPDEDGMEEIDLNNIVDGGRRTRGAQIDFAKAAAENPANDDYDEDEDEDFQPAEGEQDEDTAMSG